MFMENILEPKILHSQVLIVQNLVGSLPPMEIDEKQAFSNRLNLIFDLESEPWPKNGRDSRLAREFDLNQRSVYKWFNGQGFPQTEHCIKICKRFNVAWEWLMTGRGSMRPSSLPELSGQEMQGVRKLLESISGRMRNQDALDAHPGGEKRKIERGGLVPKLDKAKKGDDDESK